MNRSDFPYIILTFVFALAIFVAGRISAPAAPMVYEPAPSVAPSIFVIAPKPEPPVALLPEVPTVLASASAATTATVTKKSLLPTASTIKTVESSPVKAEPIFLEETPELPANPYLKEH